MNQYQICHPPALNSLQCQLLRIAQVAVRNGCFRLSTGLKQKSGRSSSINFLVWVLFKAVNSDI